jgi:hypothetical protein
MDGANTERSVVPVERPANVPEQGIQAAWRMVDAGYVRTIRIPLRRGRLFEESDSKVRPIVLSEGLARRLWPDGGDPIGLHVRFVGGQVLTVVGIVGDVRMINRSEEPQPAMYFMPLLCSLQCGSACGGMLVDCDRVKAAHGIRIHYCQEIHRTALSEELDGFRERG